MFYTYCQNNSGGYFITNDDVAEIVIIEGANVQEIQEKADKLFEHYSEYCPCCGQRWNKLYDDDFLTESPKIFGDTPEDFFQRKDARNLIFRKSAVIHYANGRKKWFYSPYRR